MIRIETHLADGPLTGQSKWWGEPDMPEELDWPTVMVRDEDGESYDDPLTFVCQIRCAEPSIISWATSTHQPILVWANGKKSISECSTPHLSTSYTPIT